MRVQHPAILWDWTRVDVIDHPEVKSLYDGDPTLGWEADPRLCLYKNDRDKALLLVRLEADNEYRAVLRRELTPDERMTSFAGLNLYGRDSMVRMIQRLISHDTQRGFDVMAATVGANDAKHAEADKALGEWLREDIADRLWYAFGWSQKPGFDILPRHARR